MHDCHILYTRFSLALDGALAPAEAAQMQAELAQCPTCRARWRAMQRLDQTLRRSPLLAPRRDLAAAVLEQIAKQHAHDRRLVGMTLLIGGALSLGPSALLGIGLLLLLLALIQPGVLQGLIALLVSGLSSLHALLLTLATFQQVFGVWLLPLLAAMLGVGMLSLTLLWATRTRPFPRYNA